MWPFELTATPAISPKWMSSGSVSGFGTDSNGSSGAVWAAAGGSVRPTSTSARNTRLTTTSWKCNDSTGSSDADRSSIGCGQVRRWRVRAGAVGCGRVPSGCGQVRRVRAGADGCGQVLGAGRCGGCGRVRAGADGCGRVRLRAGADGCGQVASGCGRVRAGAGGSTGTHRASRASVPSPDRRASHGMAVKYEICPAPAAPARTYPHPSAPVGTRPHLSAPDGTRQHPSLLSIEIFDNPPGHLSHPVLGLAVRLPDGIEQERHDHRPRAGVDDAHVVGHRRREVTGLVADRHVEVVRQPAGARLLPPEDAAHLARPKPRR